MLITVPSAAAATLQSLISSGDLTIINQAAKNGLATSVSTYKVTLQVLGAQDVYFESTGKVAALTTATKIIQNGEKAMIVKRLSDISLIANAAPNANVRINVEYL